MDGCYLIIQAVTKAGQPRYRTECDRGGTKWYSREILVPKDTSWMDEIVHATIKVKLDTWNYFKKFVFHCSVWRRGVFQML